MFCPNCGSQVDDGTVFCPNCGSKIDAAPQPQSAPQPQVQQQEEPVQPEVVNNNANTAGNQNYAPNTAAPGAEGKKKIFDKNLKGIAGIVIAIVAVIVVVKLFAGIFGGTPDNVVTVYDSDKSETTIYLNNKKVGTVDGSAYVYSNADKSAFYIENGDSDVYYLKGSKLKEVMDDCYSVVVANHSKTALLINEDGELYRYNGSKLTEITDDEVSSAVISGDGKTYAYVSDGNTYVGKKPSKEEKVKDVTIKAISDNGKYMYGIESSDSDDDDYGWYSSSGDLVYVTVKGKIEKISKDISSIVGYNSDGTEVMFTKSGKTYVSVKGKDPKKVSGGTVYGLLYKKSDEEANRNFYPIKSFKNTLAVVSDDGDLNICKINGKYETIEIVGDIDSIEGVDENLSRIYYTEDGDLYYAKVKKNAKGKKVAEDVDEVFISNNCKVVYYLDDDGDLYYLKGTGKSKKISGDFEDLYSAIAIDNVLYAYDDDDDWYYIKGTKKTKLDVDSFDYDYLTEKIYAYKDDDAYSVNGKSLKKLKGDFEDISDISVY